MANEMEGWTKANTYLASLDSKEQPCVDADKLYAELGLDSSHFSRWQKQKIKELKLKEGVDYQFSTSMAKTSPKGGRPSKVARLTLGSAIKCAVTTTTSPKGLLLLQAMTNLLQRYVSNDPTLAEEIIRRIDDPEKIEGVVKTAYQSMREGYRRLGKSESWIDERLRGIPVRVLFTETLKEHEIRGAGYGIITNVMYKEIFGMKAQELKLSRNQLKGAARECMTLVELTAVAFAEALSTNNLKEKKITGLLACARECGDISERVAKTLHHKD